jgi:hypothetical protein
MIQLSLVDLDSEQLDIEAAYNALHSSKLSFKGILASAMVIEQELDNRAIYQQLGFANIKEFLGSIPDARAEYLVAIKMIWWQKLIWGDRPVGWLRKEDFKASQFITKYNFIRFDKRTQALILHRTKRKVAKINWELLLQVRGQDSQFKDMERFVSSDDKNSEHIEALEAKIAQLEDDLERAKDGIISHLGIPAENSEIPLKYSELYCLAVRTSMSGIQYQCFVDKMLLEGYYPACRYLDQFEIIA